MRFEVTVTEILERTFVVEAESIETGLQFINDKYSNEEIVLDADDYVTTDISASHPGITCEPDFIVKEKE